MNFNLLEEVKQEPRIMVNQYALEIIKLLREHQTTAVDSELACIQAYKKNSDENLLENCYKESGQKWKKAGVFMKEAKEFFEGSKEKYETIMMDCNKNYSDSDIRVCVKLGLEGLKEHYKQEYYRLSGFENSG